MLMKLALGGLVLSVGVIGAAGFAVQQTGIAYVEIEDRNEGFRLSLPVPLILADAALAVVPDQDLTEAREELRDLEPLLRGLFVGLDEVPDATFVDVESASEHVRVAKEDGDIIVDVESPNESVYVSVPIEGAERLISTIAGW